MSIAWAEDYQPIVYQMFMAGMGSVPSLIPQLYDVRSSTNASEYHLGWEGTDTDGWETYEQTGQTGYADFDRGFPKTFTHKEYTRRFRLYQKYIEDDRMGIVRDSLQKLGISAAQLRERHAASIFNNAFTSGVGPDGVVLCSASHPYSAGNSAVYSNAGALALNYTNLKATRQAMRQWVDGLGNPLMRSGKLILHPIELQDVVTEIINAQGKPGTSDNDANAAQNFTSLAWDYLVDANNWFLLDPIWMKQSLLWYDRVALYNKIVEQTTTYVTYEFRMRYSFGWVDPRFVYGNNVSD